MRTSLTFRDFEESDVPTVNKAAVAAAEAHVALRTLVDETRAVDASTDLNKFFGLVTQAASALKQSLDQLAPFHDGATGSRVGPGGHPPPSHAAGFQVAWESRRAPERVHQVAYA